MRKQLSIVLVEGDHVPRELSGLLVGMGVWVKSTWSSGLAAALQQTTPHLVVCGDPSQLPLLKRAISETHPGTPLLLIGDWDLKRAGRAVAGGLVEDLIPDSLPAGDIARRLESLAARRAMRVPSRATLTPPTRAGIHPLLPVGADRDERTPESRQDHPAPSHRPPPLPVRVMSHGPVGERAINGSSLPPASDQAHAMPLIPRHSPLPADPFAPTQLQRSAPPPGPFRATVPGYPAPPAWGSTSPSARSPSSPPATLRPQSVPPQSSGSPLASVQARPQTSRISQSSPPPQLSRAPQLSRVPQTSPPSQHPRSARPPGPTAGAVPVRSFQPAPTPRSSPPQHAAAPHAAARARSPQSSPPPSYAPPAQGHRSYPPQSQPPQSYAPPAQGHRSYPPQSQPPQAQPPQSYPPQAQGLRSYPPQSQPPQSYPPQAQQGQYSYPYALSPDSAPPIQMVTRTTTAARARRRRSGPGFTLGAALGVAASAAAFVGVIEFERDLRVLTSQSATIVSSLFGAQKPAWLAAVLRGASQTPAEVAAAAPLASSTTLSASGSTAKQASTTAEGATGAAAPLELSDLGGIETDANLGMSLAEASALFAVEDRRLPSCEQLLADWAPPLPMIEEDRPKHGAIHRRQAQEHLVAGKPDDALQDLCKSARLDPAGPGTETLASVYLSQRSLEQAEGWIRRFLAEHPRSDSARELLGDIQSQRGKVAEAKATWLDVLGVDADATGLQREVAKHWVQDAMSAFGARDLAQAERKLRRALTLDPTNAGAAVLLARVLERQGDAAASTAWAKRARDL